MAITDMTIKDMAAGLADKTFSAVELAEAHLARIDKLDGSINAFINITAEQALSAARAADKRRADGITIGELDGIPMGLKDNVCTQGAPTTCASRMLANFVPPYDAFCWRRLADAGAVLLGKLNMDEFAMGSSTENSAFGVTHNPFSADHVPGGSSGGSAAAVAADMATYALGSDTGGSVRQPANYCGVVGIKPTYGRISRYGVVPYASSLDQVGILAKNCYDTASVLETISGHDPMDSTCAGVAVGEYRKACSRGVSGMKIGIVREFMGDAIAADVVTEIMTTAEQLRAQGAIVEEVSLPHSDYALATFIILSTAEASSNMARYDGVQYGFRAEARTMHEMFVKSRSQGFGSEVKRRIMLGTYALSAGYYDAYYNKTLQVRSLVKQDYDRTFADGFDCLLMPSAPSAAFKIGEKISDPLTMYMQDICTVPINLAGVPAMVVPRNMIDGLPFGLQLIAPPFAEETLFAVGGSIEVPRMIPPLC